MECLQYARHDVRCFICIISLSPNNDAMIQELTHVLQMGNSERLREAQRGYVTCYKCSQRDGQIPFLVFWYEQNAHLLV